MKYISKAKVLKLLIPKHSLAEQKYIASVLGELHALTTEVAQNQSLSASEFEAVLPSFLNMIYEQKEAVK